MKLWKKIALAVPVLLVVVGGVGYWWLVTRDAREPSLVAFNENCASCHGTDLGGGDGGPALVGVALRHGDDIDTMTGIIARGLPEADKDGWEDKFSPQLIKGLALYINERRQAWPRIVDSYAKVPEGSRSIRSQYHEFVLERVTTLESRPYGLDVLPNGEILVSEKERGLSLVGVDGIQGDPIPGQPEVWSTLLEVQGAWLNLGSALDVELHPDHSNNGWIYFSHTDRCQWSCGWPIPATMVRVVRGRIVDGEWSDEELIWSVHADHYTPVPDGVAAGRLAFDGKGHLYISIGGKNTYSKLHDLGTPFGKIHRVRENGDVPQDNPFWAPPEERPEGSIAHTVWSYGHRTGQGLDGHPDNGTVWNTEMGPRGGDEINLIQRGENYGWPLYTNGLDYNGEEVAIGTDLGLDFALEDTVLPAVDFTPAPAVSNFTFYSGEAFANWSGDMLVGSLKAATLYRVRIADGVEVEREKLVTDFGRIRDVEVGPDGSVYLAIEHNQNGSIWRIRPN